MTMFLTDTGLKILPRLNTEEEEEEASPAFLVSSAPD
jgi:hypothetical protein